MLHELPALPYGYRALEPYISGRTMEIHHGRHHRGYVDSLNRLLAGHEALAGMDLARLIADIGLVPREIRQGVIDNGGGHLNHSLFWETMGPNAGGQPVGRLRQAVNATFGGFTAFRRQFTEAAATLFGSGWAWLAVQPPDRLCILSTRNQDSPIMLGYRPILGLDLWEHAYYLHYQNRRKEYVEAWWQVVNWARVAQLHARAVEQLAHAT